MNQHNHEIPEEKNMFEYKFKITKIDCPACIKLAKNVLKDLQGVKKIEITDDGAINLSSDREINWEEITSALAEVGKKAEKIN